MLKSSNAITMMAVGVIFFIINCLYNTKYIFCLKRLKDKCSIYIVKVPYSKMKIMGVI